MFRVAASKMQRQPKSSAAFDLSGIEERQLLRRLRRRRRSRLTWMLIASFAAIGLIAFWSITNLPLLQHWAQGSAGLTVDEAGKPVSEIDQALLSARTEIEALRAERARAAIANADTTKAAEARVVEQQKALAREREGAEGLSRDLASARAETEALKVE